MELTTVAGVRELLQQEGEEEAGDPGEDLLESMIKAASLAVASAAQREFLPTSNATRTRSHSGGRIVNLTPWDLRSVASIEIEVDGGAETLAEEDYRLGPMAQPDGVYEWITLKKNPGECEIAIEGNWGFAAVPDDVDYFTRLTVVSWLRGDVFAYTPDIESPPPMMRGALPKEVSLGLQEAYGKVAVG